MNSEILILKEAANERKSAWQDDSKQNYDLPTGNQLMTSPIVRGGRKKDRYEKERQFVIKKINNKLKIISFEEKFQIHKWILFVVGICFALAGTVLILYGLHLTVFFEMYQNISIPAIIFGGLFMIPLAVWISFLFFPNSEEKKKRNKIYADHMERKKATFFNKMTEEAAEFATPPDRVLKVTAHIRKKNYPVRATTWFQFCEAVEKATGLFVERQLIRFKDEDLKITDLTDKLEKFGINDGDVLYVYNRGGYVTKGSPLIRQYVTLREAALQTKHTVKTLPEEELDFKSSISIFRHAKSAFFRAIDYVKEGRFLIGSASSVDKDDDDEEAVEYSQFEQPSLDNRIKYFEDVTHTRIKEEEKKEEAKVDKQPHFVRHERMKALMKRAQEMQH